MGCGCQINLADVAMEEYYYWGICNTIYILYTQTTWEIPAIKANKFMHYNLCAVGWSEINQAELYYWVK